MASRWVLQEERSYLGSLLKKAVLLLFGVGCLVTLAQAREPVLNAIELYDGPSGAAYVHLAGVLINGKAELRECPPQQSTSLDKSAYGKLAKLTLAEGGILERGADGVLRYSTSQHDPICVVPVNVKFEHKASLSPAELADLGVLTATPLAPQGEPTIALPPLKKGVKLVLVSAPDTELAEFLLGQRISSIDGWRNYLSRYPAAAHSASAKSALASLYVVAGQAYLDAYDKSVASASPSYADLKNAKLQADLAASLVPTAGSGASLGAAVRHKHSTLIDLGRGELDAYHAALAAHTAGYVHLQNAMKFSSTIASIDPVFPPGRALADDVKFENDNFEAALSSSASSVSAREFDSALSALTAYRAFAGEEPRIAAVITADYNYHIEGGQQFVKEGEWKAAIAEFERAASVRDTPEAADALKNARAQLVIAQDQAAAADALKTSNELEQKHDIIRAYQVLASLSPAQQALVADDMERLTPLYVQSASQEAKSLRQAHDPIRGLADEIEIENAYTYLQSAYQLSGNETYRDRMSLLGNEVSTYLLNQAKHYVAKPAGSGTELGWTYLSEALAYKAANLDSVRDAMIAVAASHAMRSKLSIRVQFRDQTSQRDSAGLAGQLENAIVAGLEASGVPVKVVRFGESTAVEPDYQLAGDVLQHHLSVVPAVEPIESKYLAGEHESPSDEWNKINRDYEIATMELRTAQATLQGAESKGAKKVVADAKVKVNESMKKISDLHVLLDSTDKTVTTDIIRSYTYTKKTVDISGIVQLQFRIGESLSGQMADSVPITREAHQQFIVLENVKAEDTKGIKPTGVTPDAMEVLTTLESSALESLITAVHKRVEELPKKMYAEAINYETQGDLDGAGEAFLRFLNLTRADDSAERKHAEHFLLEQFNMRPGAAAVR
jgi:hypothetical protein